jgi:hypothetical protein
MNILNNSAASERSAGTVSRFGAFAARIIAEGHWQMECQKPVQIIDPAKFSHYCERDGLILPRRFNRLLVSAKELAAYTAVASREFVDDLDAMLFGGGRRWLEAWQNLVVNEGLNHLLDVTLSGGSQDTSWFVGLLAATPSPLAAWTATEIASNDFVAYDEATLQAFTDGGVSGGSMSNTASPAAFTISTNSSSIGGAYLIGTNAKATPAGTLYAAGAFTGGNKAADDNDTLSVTSTFTMAAA